jgi:lambda repressor-like predicted transcriptional regulator
MVAVMEFVDMAKRTRSDERQVHPIGERFTVDDEWKKDVRAEIERRGMSQADLAHQIDVTPATITNLLKPGRSQSRIVARIHKAFSWTDPSTTSVAVAKSGVHRRIDRGLQLLDERDLETIAALVESLAGKR